MKKLTSLILSLALGMSALPALSTAQASDSNYDPNDLYEQFLRQLEQQDSSSSSSQESSSQPGVVPEIISEPQTPPTPQPNIQPASIKDEGQVSFTGRVVQDGSLFFLEVNIQSDSYQQVGGLFKEFILGDRTSWFKKRILLTSGNKDFIAKILKAVGNDAVNRVRVTGWGVDRNYDYILDGISVNDPGAQILNLKDPNNPNFDKYKESKKMTAEMTRTESDHYGFIEYSPKDGRVYMKMTDSRGVSMLNKYDNQIIRLMYNEEDGSQKWRSPYTIASVDAKDKAFKYLIRARAFVGTSNAGALFIRYSALDVADKIPTQLSPGTPDPEPTVRSAAPAPAPAVSPEPISRTEEFTLRLEDVAEDDCGHYPFVKELTVTLVIEGKNFRMTIIGDSTNVVLSGPALNGVAGNAQNAGTVAGFSGITVSLENGKLILGKDGRLPGACPIIYSFL